MPQWGRPSGARIGRSQRRGLPQQQQLEASARVKELGDSDGNGNGGNSDGGDDGDSDEQDVVWLGAKPARMQGVKPNNNYYLDDGKEYELHYSSSDPTIAYAMQLAMRDDDEWVLDRALGKIRRAQRLGRPAVSLSKRERDVLERSRLQNERTGQQATAAMVGGRRGSAPASPQFQRRMSDAAFASSARLANATQQMRSRTPSIQAGGAQQSHHHHHPHPPYPQPPVPSPQMEQPLPRTLPPHPPWLPPHMPPPPPPPDAFISRPPFPPFVHPPPFVSYDPHYAHAMPPPFPPPPPSLGTYYQHLPAAGPPSLQPATEVPAINPSNSPPSKATRPTSSGSSSSSDNGVCLNSTSTSPTAAAHGPSHSAGTDKKKPAVPLPANTNTTTTNGTSSTNTRTSGRPKRKK